MAKGSFVFKRIRVAKHLRPFKWVARSKRGLKNMVRNSENLKKVIHGIFSKRGLKVAAYGSIVAAGVASVWAYIESNSGCFLKRDDQPVCKVQHLSCCQKGDLDNLPFCEESVQNLNVCDNFDEQKEKSCCRLCDCSHFQCLPGETMECQRPTVSTALTHFAENVGAGIWSGIVGIFPSLRYVPYAILVIVCLYLLSWAMPPLKRLLSRGNKNA